MLDDDCNISPEDYKIVKEGFAAIKHKQRQRNRMPGKRARRIRRFIESVVDNPYSANPQIDKTKLLPNLTPPYGEQLKRGYKPPRNKPCPCGSGRKFKKCHMELETETPFLVYDEIKPRVFDPAEEAEKLLAEAGKVIKEYEILGG